MTTMTVAPTFPLTGTPLSSASFTASAPSSTATSTAPLLALNIIPPASTCNLTLISWNYTGTNDALISMFAISSYTMSAGPTPEMVLANHTVASGVPAWLGSIIWDAVDVPPGTYKIQAIIPGYSTESPSFTVTNGTQSSCFEPASPSSTLAPTPAPVSAAKGGLTSSQRAGAIAGGVIGGVLLIVAALLALFFFRRRRASSRARSLSDIKTPRDHKWNGLSSRESGLNVVSVPIAVERKMPFESLNAAQFNVGHGGARDIDEEDASTLNEEERIQAVPPLPVDGHRRRSSQSTLAESIRSSLGRVRSQSFTQRSDSASAPSSPRHASRRSADFGGSYPLSPISANAPASFAARKPVPSAGDAEPENPMYSREDTVHTTSLGNMQPMHVVVPDMPLSGRD